VCSRQNTALYSARRPACDLQSRSHRSPYPAPRIDGWPPKPALRIGEFSANARSSAAVSSNRQPVDFSPRLSIPPPASVRRVWRWCDSTKAARSPKNLLPSWLIRPRRSRRIPCAAAGRLIVLPVTTSALAPPASENDVLWDGTMRPPPGNGGMRYGKRNAVGDPLMRISEVLARLNPKPVRCQRQGLALAFERQTTSRSEPSERIRRINSSGARRRPGWRLARRDLFPSAVANSYFLMTDLNCAPPGPRPA
jgi:hypothetical protein